MKIASEDKDLIQLISGDNPSRPPPPPGQALHGLQLLVSQTPVARRKFQVWFLAKSIILSTLLVLGLADQILLENVVGKVVWNCSWGIPLLSLVVGKLGGMCFQEAL